MSSELPAHPATEARIAAEMARELDAITTAALQATAGFADRVMLAIGDQPLPQPVRAFGLALLGGHLRAATAAVGDAWRTISSGPAPVAVRAQALALVLVLVVGSIALAGGATVGAFDLFGNQAPGPVPSGGTPILASPSPSPSPSRAPADGPGGSPDDSARPGPTRTPEASETPPSHETTKPIDRPRTATPTATDDDGGGGDPGPDGGGETPSPTEIDEFSGGG